jgi:hypothetical protein
MSIDLILMIVACVCLIVAALNVDVTGGKVNIGWLGLFFWALTAIV